MKKNMIQTAKNHELGTVGAIKTFIVHRKIFDIDLFLNSKREQLKKFYLRVVSLQLSCHNTTELTCTWLQS